MQSISRRAVFVVLCAIASAIAKMTSICCNNSFRINVAIIVMAKNVKMNLKAESYTV